MSDLDKKIKELLSNDKIPFEVDPAIQQRLNYQLQLKASSATIKQNSIFPFLATFFTTKLLGLKISVLTIVLFTFIGYKQINHPNSIYTGTDTASVYQSMDTLNNLAADDTLSLR